MAKMPNCTAHEWHQLVSAYSEAIPTVRALELLAAAPPLVEIGAGGGYWARLLKDLGVDIVAYDLVASESNSWTAELPAWTDVRVGDAIEALHDNPDRVPFACWPPRPHGYMDDVMRVYGGPTLTLITDGRVRLFGEFTDRPVARPGRPASLPLAA